MGLSASQGRLLSLTSRMSDLERRSQSISNQKMRLTATSADASQKYQQALNMEKITFNNGYNTVVATAQNLTEYNPNITTQRFLNTADGKLLVNNKVASALNGCNGDLDAFLHGMGLTTADSSVSHTSYSEMLNSSTEALQEQVSSNLTAISYFNDGNYGDFADFLNDTVGTDEAKALATSTEILNSGLLDGSATEIALAKINFPEHSSINHLVETGLLNEKSGHTISKNYKLAQHADSLVNNLNNYNGTADSKTNIEQAIADYKSDVQNVSNEFATYFGVSISEDEAESKGLKYQVPNPDLNLENKGSLSGIDSDQNGLISESEYGSLSYQRTDNLIASHNMVATAGNNSNSLYNQMVQAMGIQNDDAKKDVLTNALKEVLSDYLRQIPYDFDAKEANIDNAKIKEHLVNVSDATTTFVSSESQNSGLVEYNNNGNSNGVEYGQYQTREEKYADLDATLNALDLQALKDTSWKLENNSRANISTEDTGSLSATDYRDAKKAAEDDDLRLHVNTAGDNGFSISTTQAMKRVLNLYENSLYGTSACVPNLNANNEVLSYNRISGAEVKNRIGEAVNNIFKTTDTCSVNDQVKAYLSRFENYTQYMKPDAASEMKAALESLKRIGNYDDNLKVTSNIINTIATVSGPENFAENLNMSINEGKVIYYTNIFNEVMAKGGIPDGYATLPEEHKNSAEWLNTNLTSGNVYISSKEDTSNITELSTRLNYKSDDMCITVEADDAYIAKAEAEYDAAMNEINAKEKRLDIELEQNSTEYAAVQQEMESVKKVMQKNIDRTFKIFG